MSILKRAFKFKAFDKEIRLVDGPSIPMTNETHNLHRRRIVRTCLLVAVLAAQIYLPSEITLAEWHKTLQGTNIYLT